MVLFLLFYSNNTLYMRKIFFLTFYLLLITTVFSQDNGAVNQQDSIWSFSYEEALKKAKKEKKPLLIYFKGSDWCGPCKTLDKELFSTEKFKKLSKKHFVLYEADIPMNVDLVAPDKLALNKRLVSKFKVTSYPTLLFLNGRKKILGVKKGLILTEYYYPFFESIIEK